MTGVHLFSVNVDFSREDGETWDFHAGETQISRRSVSAMHNIDIELSPLYKSEKSEFDKYNFWFSEYKYILILWNNFNYTFRRVKRSSR